MSEVFGYVKKDGSITSGSGDFTVTKDSRSGIYNVSFSSSFQAKPALLATVAVNKDDPSDQSKGKIATANNVATNGFQLIIQDGGGSRQDHDFSFLAIGS